MASAPDTAPPDTAAAPARRPRPRRLWSRRGWQGLAVLVGVLVLGNLAIASAFGLSRLTSTPPEIEPLPGIHHARVVAPGLWRGWGPTEEGYAALAERGVTTVVDLRAEHRDVPTALLADLGLERVPIPIRDGQTPTPEQVRRFFDVVDRSEGIVYVHCSAGVGRTGTMAAAYAVHEAGVRGPWEALRRNLAVGPPSLEQIVFVAGLDRAGDIEPPPRWVSAVSRVFDGPRRIWSRLREGQGLTL